jgi:UDP-glucose 4-epimerase
MKISVFGGSGFLGSHVADALAADGYEVVIFDLKASPYLQHNQKMIVGSITDKTAVEKAVKGCDVVYNFAGIADIDEARGNPVKTVEINILGNTIILDACRKNKVKRFVFASSLYVYSESGSFYRSSKQACELIVENFYRVFGLPFTILRYGSLYGPRADEKNWVYRTLKQALTSGKITRYGSREEVREYIHVEDAARISKDILSNEFENQYVVISSPQQSKIKDIFVMINEMLGNKIEIEYLSSSLEPNSESHYEVTPYSFNPIIAKKIISDYYLDLGQGILQVLQEIHKTLLPYEEINETLVLKNNNKK